MKIEPLTSDDLQALTNLQPPDWPDILPDISYYLKSSYCYPLKAVVDNELAGTGSAIIFGETAWLAHIIVHPDFRNHGIGYAIVNALLDITHKMKIPSCVLTATPLGKPVYTKAGFKSVAEYAFFKHMETGNISKESDCITYDALNFSDQIYRLDHKITGENRRMLLQDFIHEAILYVQQGQVLGYYLPTLKEGPVVAVNTEAGLELMKMKFSCSERIVLPAENTVAIGYLTEHGYRQTDTIATKMVTGKEVIWKPECIFSRAGGNFG